MCSFNNKTYLLHVMCLFSDNKMYTFHNHVTQVTGVQTPRYLHMYVVTYRYVYVAVSVGQELRVFQRKTDNSLTLQQVHNVTYRPHLIH